MADSAGRRGHEPLPPAVIEDIVDPPRRRAVLAHLADCGQPVALTDLAGAVGATEAGVDPEEIRPERRREIREEIYQSDLPKLTATGIVEFDSMQGTLTLRDEAIAERVS